MRLSKNGVLLAAVAALLGAAPLPGQRVPQVLVTFRLTEHTFQNSFPDLARVHSVTAEALAAKLDSSVRFVKFVTRGPADYELAVTLDRLHRGSPGASEVGFYTSLISRGGAAPVNLPSEYWVMFRTQAEYHDPRGPTAEHFVRRVRERIPAAAVRLLMRERLRQIPVASGGSVYTQPPIAWLLPFQHSDLCLDYRSTFAIDATYRSSGGETHIPMTARARTAYIPPAGTPSNSPLGKRRGYVLAVPDAALYQNETEFLRAIRNRTAGVRRVFVEEYVLNREACDKPTSPQAAFGLGGAQ